MKIGIDLDNTLICYDPIFEMILQEKGVPLKANQNAKEVLKAWLRTHPDGEYEWTRLQGEIYGPRVLEAKPFKGGIEFIRAARKKGLPVCIISHKSKYSVVGQPHRLHDWALRWLESQGLLGGENALLNRSDIFLETNKNDKLERMRKEGCTHFVDDLENILSDSAFPESVERVWFHTGSRTPEGWMKMESWEQADFLLNEKDGNPVEIKTVDNHQGADTQTENRDERDVITGLLQQIGAGEIKTCLACTGGANNRALKVVDSKGKEFFAKIYFRSAEDKRDRLKHEFGFLKYIQSLGMDVCAKPIIRDEDSGSALYEYLEGERFEKGDSVDEMIWDQCLNFLIGLQRERGSKMASHLPAAADSAFTLEDHLHRVRIRREEWLEWIREGKVHADVCSLLENEFEQAYQKIAKEVFLHPDFRKGLELEERILSPSDFGLHNALRKPDGRMVFVDFEYAGWDDPAKTLCDFFLQPRIRPPSKHFSEWESQIAQILSQEHASRFRSRMEVMKKIQSLKWAFILLNEYHPQGRARRSYSTGVVPEAELPGVRKTQILEYLR